MPRTAVALAALLITATPALAAAEIERREANNGQLLMEDVPAIPESVAQDLNRYQNVRSAAFLDWTADSQSMYIATRFAEVPQIHRVDQPGGARRQLTFFNEPVGEVARQPGGRQLAFTRDAGGSEFAQIFLLEPGTGADPVLLTDGESRNGGVVWDRAGKQIAYYSTRRNGASNDIWLMDTAQPGNARMVMQAGDGSQWAAMDFSADNKSLLLQQYLGNSESRIYALDIASGTLRRLAGSDTRPSSNTPIAFDDAGNGFWYVSDAAGDYQQLVWQSMEENAQPEIVSGAIDWDVEEMILSADRKRGAFAVNENGFSRLYLLDTATRKFAPVKGLPTGVAITAGFSPDGRKLAITLNTPQTPSDAFVLSLGSKPLQAGELTRWTYSEVGGLDSNTFIEPELVRFPTFDSDSGGPASIPAWVYKPRGPGPHPVVISIHGGPEAQSRPYFSSTYQMWLEKLGVAVVVPNVRGSTGYGKAYKNLDNGFLRENSVKDIGALLDWIATRDDLDQNRVAVFGGSYGGYMVLASSVHYSDRLQAAVDVVGISHFVTFLENTQNYRRDLRRAEYGDERDPAMRAHFEKISPLNRVADIAIPLFVIQGQNDPRVPVTEAEQIVAELRRHGQPVWYMNALNEGHGYAKKENVDIYQQATLLFLQEYLVNN
ncbi:S9 family peptidase [Haliea sp. E17]|uniref:S9 family peptidase n=1 Tax=Haliea sp. E17 TaxID=3401576 RepID=UPI003AB0A205